MVKKLFLAKACGKQATILDRISDIILYNRVGIFIRHIFRFIRRLPTFLKLCWKQENWDSGYIYDLLEYKLKDLREGLQQDTWHEQNSVKRCINQINICLAYLDRYRNWPDYYDYPIDDIYFEPTNDDMSQLKYNSSKNEAKRKGAHDFEKFNYDMFWKRFLQWHQGWWT